MVKLSKLLCRLFGHKLLKDRYHVFNFLDGKISWTQECKRCNKAIYCIKGFIPTQPNYICKTELSTSIEEIKKVS